MHGNMGVHHALFKLSVKFVFWCQPIYVRVKYKIEIMSQKYKWPVYKKHAYNWGKDWFMVRNMTGVLCPFCLKMCELSLYDFMCVTSSDIEKGCVCLVKYCVKRVSVLMWSRDVWTWNGVEFITSHVCFIRILGRRGLNIKVEATI